MARQWFPLFKVDEFDKYKQDNYGEIFLMNPKHFFVQQRITAFQEGGRQQGNSTISLSLQSEYSVLWQK